MKYICQKYPTLLILIKLINIELVSCHRIKEEALKEGINLLKRH